MCISSEQLSSGPAGGFLLDVVIEVGETKRPIDLLIVEDQRVENGAPVLSFRAERQDRRLTLAWKGGKLVDRPDDEGDMLCRAMDSVPITPDGFADTERALRQIYMSPLDREARYLLGYDSLAAMFLLLQIKGEVLDIFRQASMTPSDSTSVLMFGDTPAPQQ